MLKKLTVLVVSLFVALIVYQFVSNSANRREITTLASKCPLIYLCENKNGNAFIVSRILKGTQEFQTKHHIQVGQIADLNRVRLKMDKDATGMEVVVFVEPDSSKAGEGYLNQSEIPIVDNRLISYPVTLSELLRMIANTQK